MPSQLTTSFQVDIQGPLWIGVFFNVLDSFIIINTTEMLYTFDAIIGLYYENYHFSIRKKQMKTTSNANLTLKMSLGTLMPI